MGTLQRIFSSPWARIAVLVVLLSALVFLSETRAFLVARRAVLDAVSVLSRNRIGLFLAPRAEFLGLSPEDTRAAEIRRLRAELDELRKERDAVRSLVDGGLAEIFRSAAIFFYSSEGGRELILADAGTDDGVGVGALAFDENLVLVGTVVEASARVAKIDIATNIGNVFDARILPTDTAVLARGTGGGSYRIELVPIATPIRAGDAVGFTPKRSGLPASARFWLAEVAAEGGTESTVFKWVRGVSPVVPSSLTRVFLLP